MLVRLVRARYVVFGLSLITSVFVFQLVIEVVDPRRNFNILSDFSWVLRREEYKFFSGSEGGFYISVGRGLEAATDKSGPIKFLNRESRGALENARSVTSNTHAFGLVQEDTLAANDFLRDHLRYITPLYLERMHIIYDSQSYREFIDENYAGTDLGDRTASLSPGQQHTIDFLAQAKISTGPVGSGSRLFARYLLAHCNIEGYSDLGLGSKESMRRLDGEGDLKIDVAFNIAGAPLRNVLDILERGGGNRYRLMSIEASVVPKLNEEYNLRLQADSFKDKYPGGNSISTFGSWAFLISSKDVSDTAAFRTLQELDTVKGDIRREIGLRSGDFQLTEFKFFDTFKSQHTTFGVRLARNLLIFTAFVSLLTALTISFLSRVVSGFCKVRYFRGLTCVYRALPLNTNLDPAREQFPVPVIFKDQKSIIRDLVEGMSDLLGIASHVRISYDSGELRINHYTLLLSTIDNLREIFQGNLAQRLNEYFANYGEYDGAALRHYFTAGYLSRQGVRDLERTYGGDRGTGAQSAELALAAEQPPDPGLDDLRIFISYRRDDANFAAGRIRERLTSHFGANAVFQDVIDIPGGHDFRDVTGREISRCHVVLCLMGSDWINIMRERHSQIDPVRVEIETAFQNEVPVIPVLLAPAHIPHESDLPTSIAAISYLNAVTVRPDPEFHGSLDRLVEAVEELARNRPSARKTRSAGRAKKKTSRKRAPGRGKKPTGE